MKRAIAMVCVFAVMCSIAACASQSDFDEIKASLEKRHFTVLGVGLNNDDLVVAQVSWGECTGRVEYMNSVSTADRGGVLKMSIPVHGSEVPTVTEIVNPSDANTLMSGAFAHCAPASSTQK